MNNNLITVELHLSALAWHALKRECGTDRTGAVLLPGSRYYSLVVSQLERRYITPGAYINKRSKGEAGRVMITMYDFRRYGCYVRPDRQERISKVIEDDEKHRLCLLVAALHATGLPRDTCMRWLLLKEGYNFEAMNFAKLKKHYQRNYGLLEGELEQNRHEIRKQNKQKYSRKSSLVTK